LKDIEPPYEICMLLRGAQRFGTLLTSREYLDRSEYWNEEIQGTLVGHEVVTPGRRSQQEDTLEKIEKRNDGKLDCDDGKKFLRKVGD